MKTLDRYIISSFLKTSLGTLAICTLLIVAVELFSSIDNYLTNNVPFPTILLLSVLGAPEYLMMVASVSFLFGSTFTLSQLESNNEMIMLLNAGFSYRRVCVPIVATALLATALLWCFSETVMIDATVRKDRMDTELFGMSGTRDNSDVSLSAVDGSYMINAGHYSEDTRRLHTVEVVRAEEGRITTRLSASRADWDEGAASWVFTDGRVYETSSDGQVTSRFFDTLALDWVDLAPSMFRDQSRDIATMDRADATEYLRRIKAIDSEVWHVAATEYYSRLTAPLAVLVLTLISCLMNYRYKKNVFLFSIIQSLCTAVVYYVCQMVTTIMAEQAIIHPLVGVLAPIAAVLVLCLPAKLLGMRNG